MWFFTKQLHFKQTTKHKAFYNEKIIDRLFFVNKIIVQLATRLLLIFIFSLIYFLPKLCTISIRESNNDSWNNRG